MLGDAFSLGLFSCGSLFWGNVYLIMQIYTEGDSRDCLASVSLALEDVDFDDRSVSENLLKLVLVDYLSCLVRFYIKFSPVWRVRSLLPRMCI